MAIKNKTKAVEQVAESLVVHALLRNEIHVHKPFTDDDGTDLMASETVEDAIKITRLQCEGRSVSSRGATASIQIPKDYVTDAFLVFLYVEDGDMESHHLFMFTAEQVRAWTLNAKAEYTLSFTRSNFKDKFADQRFDADRAEVVRRTIRESNTPAEIRVIWPVTAAPTLEAIPGAALRAGPVSSGGNSYRIEDDLIHKRAEATGVESIVGQASPGVSWEFNPATDTTSAVLK